MEIRRLILGLALCCQGCVGIALSQTTPDAMPGVSWPATDDLGRRLSTFEEVGPPRSGKYVGMFYFLWLGESGDDGPFDISKILASDPAAIQNPGHSLWGPLWAPHHWGESIFGHYRSNDESVLRKHAQMLSDAGVDFIVFDVTNQLTYPRSWQALCRVFDRVRREGNRAPQIAFLCPFWDPSKVVGELWDQLYGKALYPDLWFRWEGKPLILADPAMLGEKLLVDADKMTPVELTPRHTLGQTFTIDKPCHRVGAKLVTWYAKDSAATLSLYRNNRQGKRLETRRVENIVDNGWGMLDVPSLLSPGTYYLELSDPKGKVGWLSQEKDVLPGGTAYRDGAAATGDRGLMVCLRNPRDEQIQKFFTFRKPQPDYFQGPTGPNQWAWLEVFPQHAFYKTPGVPEQVAVGVAQNAVEGKLSVFTAPGAHGRSFHDGKEPGPEGQNALGLNFSEQWKRALKIDPSVVFVTGWNEWFASRLDSKFPLYKVGPVAFCDEFTQEFSRDIEPMKGGHGDDYYYQLISNVRRFKGMQAIPPLAARDIVVDGKFDDWKNVRPEYRDTIGDPVHRDHPGWGNKLRYVNQTGRNDIVAAKTSVDERNVYFYVRTREKLTAHTDPNWMLLFIDVDSNPKTGWLGYDVVVNRKVVDPNETTLERNDGGRYAWNAPAKIAYRAVGNELELAIPRELVKIQSLPATIDFKWADNIQQTGDWSDFTLNGDAAPNDRFNYRVKLERPTATQ
jgi:hypothetical protein